MESDDFYECETSTNIIVDRKNEKKNTKAYLVTHSIHSIQKRSVK